MAAVAEARRVAATCASSGEDLFVQEGKDLAMLGKRGAARLVVVVGMSLLLGACGGGDNTEEQEEPLGDPTSTSVDMAPTGFEKVAEFSGTADFESEPLPIGEQQAMVSWALSGTVQEFALSVDGSAPGKVDTLTGQRFYKRGSKLRVSFLGAGTWRVTVYRQGPAPTTVPTTTPAQARAKARADAAAQLPQRVADWRRAEDQARRDCLTPAYPGDSPEPQDWQPGNPPTLEGGGSTGNCNRLR